MMPSWKITPKVQEELKNNLNIHFQIIYKDILDQNEILKLINRVLDLFQNKDTTFLDPVTKSGVFLREIAKRLNKGLETQIPNQQERINHIFKNQLYGIAITELTSLLARRSTYCSKKANGKLVWSTAFWDMTQNENGTYLTIKQKLNGNPVTFKLEGDSEHLVLSNNKLKTVLASISGDKDTYSGVKADLVGSWKSPFYDTKTKEVANTETKVRHMWKQGFEFNEDGTFVRHQQEGKKAESESGVWTLSKDGNFIKLHFAKDGNVENIYKREVLNIDQFRNDWMRVNTESADKDQNISAYDLHKRS